MKNLSSKDYVRNKQKDYTGIDLEATEEITSFETFHLVAKVAQMNIAIYRSESIKNVTLVKDLKTGKVLQIRRWNG